MVSPALILTINYCLTLLKVEAVIGGFGMDNASEFSWNTLAELGYDLSKRSSLWLGYRALGVDYKTGTEMYDLKFDLTISGPVLGEGFRF